MTIYRGVIRKYRQFLPDVGEDNIVSINEGNTPLIYAKNLSSFINPSLRIYLKYEGLNPTGSFKDRGMTVAVSMAKQQNSRAVICASTGNTSASASAYAASADIKAYVIIPEGKIALGKLSQAIVHGAMVIQVRGNFDEALKLVREISQKYPVTLVNSLNPYRLQGQKTAAFEVCDQLARVPDYHCLPVGNAGNITAYWMGYREYRNNGYTDKLPVMVGFQAEGAAPIVRGYAIKNPETVATAIRIGNPASWKKAEQARDESGGLIDMVSDREILDAYKLVARMEGVFCEPASAASIAGLMKLNGKGYFKPDSYIVCTLTGHGLKDPDTALRTFQKPVVTDPVLDEVLKIMEFE
ncbi:MAG: threonine synthase [Deltaproteobacteria bacterium]|nr:threonine synthase [Deltaproteobacteria bacterium]MCL5276244.1 threonine synthase [Deltaproteobacteria bacterium]